MTAPPAAETLRIHLLSDLHIEWAPYEPAPVDADVVVLAGDIWQPGKRARAARAIEWTAAAFPDVPVLFVPGNHCYYGSNILRIDRKLQEAAAGTHVQVLQRREVTIKGVRFLGSTLWTDFALVGDVRAALATANDPVRGMSDYARIRLGGTLRKLRPEDTLTIHRQHIAWLRDRLIADPATPTVIITHHAPSAASLHPGTEDDPLSPAYASDLADVTNLGNVKLWLHGHTHRAADYQLGRTRVVSNPRGYVTEPVAGFDPGLVVELQATDPHTTQAATVQHAREVAFDLGEELRAPLSDRDRDRLLEMLNNPPAPTDALRRAAERHRELKGEP